MTDVHNARLLREVPPEVLFVSGAKGRPRPGRVGALVAWCEARGFRPTLAEVEAERERRREVDRQRTER